MKNKSKISANTLFHFTSSSERLLDILEDTFHPRYCPEDISTIEKEYTEGAMPNYAIPMTCFCDIPLSEIGDHTEEYGNYAIGLTKDWGIKNGINPILYTIPNTTASKTIRALADYSINLPTEQYSKELFVNMTYLSCFTKKYIGKQFKDGKYKDELINLYNEREWRYVPQIEKITEMKIDLIMPMEVFLNPETKNSWNQILRDGCKIHFTPNDIRYIIVKEEKEIVSILDKIMQIKARFLDEEKKLLTTRIISMENIRDDF